MAVVFPAIRDRETPAIENSLFFSPEVSTKIGILQVDYVRRGTFKYR